MYESEVIKCMLPLSRHLAGCRFLRQIVFTEREPVCHRWLSAEKLRRGNMKAAFRESVHA